MKCNPNREFVIVGENEWIELRKKNGEFISSICCQECVEDLEKIIKEFKKNMLTLTPKG